MLDKDAILDEAGDIADDAEAVGAEAQEIVFEVTRSHLLSYLRGVKMEYEATGHNYIASLVIDKLIRELNND